MVIDPNISDVVRVTVIATGFGEPEMKTAGRVRPQVSSQTGTTGSMPAEAGFEKKLEIPTFSRKQKDAAGDQVRMKKVSVMNSTDDEDKYEIPTFLRKQAD